MSTYKIFWIFFLIHLLPVMYALFVISQSKEGVMVWLLFLLLDFPLSWLFFMVNPVIHWVSESGFWRFVLAPAIFFQIVGTVNWMLIYLAVTGLLKIFR